MKRLSRVFGGQSTPLQLSETSPSASTPDCTIEGRSIDEARPVRVVVIGAGISGIIACIRLVQRIPNLDLCIYDKNPDIGGTWFENRYPGCACGMLYFCFSVRLLCVFVIRLIGTSRHPCAHLPGHL